MECARDDNNSAEKRTGGGSNLLTEKKCLGEPVFVQHFVLQMKMLYGQSSSDDLLEVTYSLFVAEVRLKTG